MYLPTLVSPISMPSLSNSPWMRGAPKSGLARLMVWIRYRTSPETVGLPAISVPDLPSPKQAEAFAVPGDDSLGFDDDQSGSPNRPRLRTTRPKTHGPLWST